MPAKWLHNVNARLEYLLIKKTYGMCCFKQSKDNYALAKNISLIRKCCSFTGSSKLHGHLRQRRPHNGWDASQYHQPNQFCYIQRPEHSSGFCDFFFPSIPSNTIALINPLPPIVASPFAPITGTIDGSGVPGGLIIDGAATYSAFILIGNSAPGSGQFTISNMTIQNVTALGGPGGTGFDGGGGGGGLGGGVLLLNGANATVQSIAFTNNSAQGGNGGDAIDVEFNAGVAGGGGIHGAGGGAEFTGAGGGGLMGNAGFGGMSGGSAGGGLIGNGGDANQGSGGGGGGLIPPSLGGSPDGSPDVSNNDGGNGGGPFGGPGGTDIGPGGDGGLASGGGGGGGPALSFHRR